MAKGVNFVSKKTCLKKVRAETVHPSLIVIILSFTIESDEKYASVRPTVYKTQLDLERKQMYKFQ